MRPTPLPKAVRLGYTKASHGQGIPTRYAVHIRILSPRWRHHTIDWRKIATTFFFFFLATTYGDTTVIVTFPRHVLLNLSSTSNFKKKDQ
ncbi:hypothetical protein CEXT_133921 [Caerostris extrusa]|uniref:Uncharacterized protein n=1 Tax=Caerostris extrusa TaxID=172846 RepID=A0AAV4XT10_CAEEX|nr:hypothetical protein CEXT_133921 [Caerostris extrusa]